MKKTVSIAQFSKAIHGLPSDKPRDVPGVWYKTQKQHWLRWLSDYDEPGHYGRVSGKHRDARFAYNHIVNHQMLLWLIEAAQLSPALVAGTRRAGSAGATMMHKSGAIRKKVPWTEIAKRFWGTNT